jgi:Tfp pilus assembly protein PilZ
LKPKRRHPRFVVEGVEGRIGLRAHVELLDVGPGGAAIRSKRKLNVGDEYALSFEVGGQSVTIKGVVVWSVPSQAQADPDHYSAGIKFTAIPPAKLKALVEAAGQDRVTPERRVAGIRLQFQVPGKAFLESVVVYKVRLVSLSGVLIETARRPEGEGVYEMEILPPGREAFAFTGRVRSSFEVADAVPPRYEIGIEFLDMSSEARERLNGFVAWLAALPNLMP